MIDNTVFFQILKDLGRNKKGSEIVQDLFFYKNARYGKEDFRKGVENKNYPFRLCLWPSYETWNKYAEGNDLYASYCKERKEKQPFHDQEYPLAYCFSSHAYYTLLDYALNSRKASDACSEILKTLNNMRVSDEEQDYAKKIANANKDKESSLQDLVYFIVETAEAAAKRETVSRETQLSICQKEEKSGTKNDSPVAEAKDFTSLPKNDVSFSVNKMDKEHSTDTTTAKATSKASNVSYRLETPSTLMAAGFGPEDLADSLSALYLIMRSRWYQPSNPKLSESSFWLNLILQADADEQLQILLALSPEESIDSHLNDKNELLAGFCWAKPFWPQNAVVQDATIIPWEALELSPVVTTLPTDIDPYLCCLAFYLYPWHTNQESIGLLRGALEDTLLKKAEAGIFFTHIFARATAPSEEAFWKDIGFTPISKISGIISETERVVIGMLMAVDTHSFASKGDLRLLISRHFEPSFDGHSLRQNEAFRNALLTTVSLALLSHPEFKVFSFRYLDNCDAAFFYFPFIVGSSEDPFTHYYTTVQLTDPVVKVESSLPFILRPECRLKVEELLSNLNYGIPAGRFRLYRTTVYGYDNVYMINYTESESYRGCSINSLHALLDTYLSTLESYIQPISAELWTLAEPIPDP